jgi:type II secretory pathway component PulK
MPDNLLFLYASRRQGRRRDRGSILIFALWALGMLVVFALIIALTIGQRIQLAARVEARQHLRNLVTSGIKKGIAALEADIQRQEALYTADNKYYRHHNDDVFKTTELGPGTFQVVYPFFDEQQGRLTGRFGVVDEESKLNINFATRDELLRLVRTVTTASGDEAARIADGIIGWRSFGDAELSGFYSQDYYAGLEDPYEPKSADFEVFEELLLVQGVTPPVYHQLLAHITVYGDGLVNVNNAPPPVLAALGFEDGLIEKVLAVRRGPDGIEATADDHIFRRAYDIAAEINASVELEPSEARQIDLLNALQKIKTESAYFRIQALAVLDHRSGEMEALAVYNAVDRWIEYYREN